MDKTIGREVGSLSIPNISRSDPTDDESSILVDFEFTDAGGDDGQFEIEYTLFGGTPWIRPLPARELTIGPPSPRGLDLVRHIKFALNPATLNLPFGDFGDFAVQVRHLESFARFPTTPNLPEVRASAWLPNAKPLKIGKPPTIRSVSVPDPARPTQGEPRFVVPIAIRIESNSARAQRLRFDVKYRLAATDSPITFARADDGSKTAREIVLPHKNDVGRDRVHYLLWNVLADQGLGISLADHITADLEVVATVLDPSFTTESARLRSNTDRSSSFFLSTNPFVDFEMEELLYPANRLVSAVVSSTSRTRDIFFGRLPPPGLGSQEYIVGIDQTFAPIQLPELQTFDIRNANGYSYGTSYPGVGALYPTDFRDGPDCFARVENDLYLLDWPVDGGGQGLPGSQRISVPGDGIARGADSFDFMAGPRPAFFFFAHDGLGANDVARVHLKSVVYDLATNGWLVTPIAGEPGFFEQVLPRYDPSAAPLIDYAVVGGDFDSNPATTEVILANRGAEAAAIEGQPAGWLHRIRMVPDVTGRVIFEPPEALPRLPSTPDPRRRVSEGSSWVLRTWRQPATPTQPAGRATLLLARTYDARPIPGEVREHVFQVLRQDPGGGFDEQAWDLWGPGSRNLTQHDVGARNLGSAFVANLAGALDPDREPEIVALFGDNTLGVQVWVETTTQGGRVWRKVLDNLRVPTQYANHAFDLGSSDLVDVNGDEHVDVMLKVTSTGRNSGYLYIASAVSGVGGDLADVPTTAGDQRAVRPGVIDLNRDGYPDILAAGAVHAGRFDGTFFDPRGPFKGRRCTLHVSEGVRRGRRAPPESRRRRTRTASCSSPSGRSPISWASGSTRVQHVWPTASSCSNRASGSSFPFLRASPTGRCCPP